MNPQELYKQAIGMGDQEISEEERQKQINIASEKQKELEMWAQWRQHPVTQIFIKRLTEARLFVLAEVAMQTTNVPAVNEHWIRGKLVSAHILNIIISKTVIDGTVLENQQS